MYHMGRRHRIPGSITRPLSSVLSPSQAGKKPDDVAKIVSAFKQGTVDTDNVISANTGAGSINSQTGNVSPSPFGAASSKVDRFNPIFDDLSRGTVAEDWIPRDPRLQNRMFRMMYARGVIEGPYVDLVSDLIWSDFEMTGIKDKVVRDTYYAAKEAVRVDKYLPSLTKEYMILGRVLVQMVLNQEKGIWSDMVVYDSDYLQITPIPRTGYMPKVDFLPPPEMQIWARSTDPRDVDSKKGIPKQMLDQMASSAPIPLDPTVTAYIPRRLFFNDPFGTSVYTRVIPLWGLEKSLINATLTGHRRRAGPIMQIAVGSDTWQPTPEQIDAIASAYIAAEGDTVSSVIGTYSDVTFNQVRGGLAGDLWKWSDDWMFLQEAKMRAFGVSDSLLSGDAQLDTAIAPTMFLERLKSIQSYFVETLLMQKFFRGLALLHGFRVRSQASLDHRVYVNGGDEDSEDLILPSLVFKRNLHQTPDAARADLLDRMEEKGIPVGMGERTRVLGGGDLMERFREVSSDMELRLKAVQLLALNKKINEMLEQAGSTEATQLKKQAESMAEQLKAIHFDDDTQPLDIAKMDEDTQQRAEDMMEMDAEGAVVHRPSTTKTLADARLDLAMDYGARAQLAGSLSKTGQIG
jgi:hypothetical protein